jgi:hypothetical protein
MCKGEKNGVLSEISTAGYYSFAFKEISMPFPGGINPEKFSGQYLRLQFILLPGTEFALRVL